MAIEAARQRAIDMDISISGYDLRQINFSQALVIPEASGQVETMLCMKPYPESSKTSSGTWDEFFIYSASEKGEWIEHCRGHISVRQTSQLNVVDGQNQKDMTRSDHARQRSEAESECTRLVQGSDLYAQCSKIGMEYGPIFANLREARVGNARAIGRVTHPDVENVMPVNYQSRCVMHPATLDAFFHVAIAALERLHSAAVPTFITSLFISGDIPSTPQHEFSVYGTMHNGSQRNPTISLNVYDTKNFEFPSVEVDGLQMTSLSGQQGAQITQEPRKSYYRTNLRPDVSLLSPPQFSTLCSKLRPTSGETQLASLIDEAFYYMADKAIKQLPENTISGLSSKGVNLYRSLKRIVEYVDASRLPYDVSSWVAKNNSEREDILKQVRISGDEGNFAVLVGNQFPEIILGTVDPLALTMKDDVLGRYYANNTRMARQYQQGAVLVDLLAHKDPHLKVLEIGAGTGGATLPLLTALGGIDDSTPPRFLSYDVTDITTGFFEKLQQKTAAWGELVSYKKLDIEKDPEEQGFETEHYDLIVAANVLHATTNMHRTMANVRRLLKPGGTLLLVELIPTMAGITNIFGIFDGWWMGEEEGRRDSPLLSEERWDTILRGAGFSGLDLTLPDTTDITTHQGTTMVSRAIAAAPPRDKNELAPIFPQLVLVTTNPNTDRDSDQIVQQISENSRLGDSIQEVVDLESLQPNGRICILLELESSILSHMTEPRLEALKKMLDGSHGLIWVTKGASDQSTNPDLSLVSGFLRTLRVETGRPLVHLDLDPEVDSATPLTNAIVKVHESRFEKDEPDSEFIERGGVVMIPRHMEDDKTGIHIASRRGNSFPEMDVIPQSGRSLKLQIAQLGLLDTFYFDEDPRVEDRLPDNYIEIEVKANALNFRDIMMASYIYPKTHALHSLIYSLNQTMGQIEATDLGYECSGVITKVGLHVQDLKIGDRVMAAGDGAFCTFFRIHELAACKIPESMTFETAATIPVAYGTAYYSLKAARLTKEDTVLIHASTGALGQALIMMCQNVGSRILATVGTLEKKAFLMTEFGIPEEQIFYSRDNSFKQGVMRATDGKGVDVVFNSLSSELQRVTWECTAPFGRFIELGRRDFIVNSRLEQARFRDNVTFVGLDYRHMTIARPQYVQEAFHGYMDLIQQGKLRAPQPISIYGLGEVEKAFRTMQSGKHIGKLVIVAKEGEHAKVRTLHDKLKRLLTDSERLCLEKLHEPFSKQTQHIS
jgi:NADPH:quinone reductase-like Zn-dependent oxidoreductase/ubiquinone/menaquinone biosynthesis C-methylase UbiE